MAPWWFPVFPELLEGDNEDVIFVSQLKQVDTSDEDADPSSDSEDE